VSRLDELKAKYPHPALAMLPCKGCGKTMVFAGIVGRGFVPLDVSSPVYRLDADGTAARVLNEGNEAVVGIFVSHFRTCPRASDFSGSKPAGGEEP
jgi:hypothetical protein